MPETVQLRIRIRALQNRRRALESKLLQPQEMIAASLLERFLGSGSRRRASPSYYLSRSQQGSSKLSYVKQQELELVRRQCQAYGEFRENLAEWRQLSRELKGLFQRLLAAQAR